MGLQRNPDPTRHRPQPDPLLYDDVNLDAVPLRAEPQPEDAGGATAKKSKRLPEEEHPSWLPEDWRVEFRMRISGATAGTYDRYFFSPTGKRFRSKAEVLHFLETGSKKKRKADPDGMPQTSSENQKPKEAKKMEGDFSCVDFDFRNPPENVSWTLTNASHDIWTPSGEEGLIPEPVKKTWDDVFSCITELEVKQ